MKFEFLYQDRVDDDIDEALDYYFSANPELIEIFLNRLEEAKDRILKSPEGFEVKHKNIIRTVLLKQFPYHLHYLINEDKIIVLAILHAYSGKAKTQGISTDL